jgi:hypothetical protein
LDVAGSGGAKFEPIRETPRNYKERSTSIHEQFDFLAAAGWPGKVSWNLEDAHT